MERNEFVRHEFESIIKLKCNKYVYVHEFIKTKIDKENYYKFNFRQLLRERLNKKYRLRFCDIMKMKVYRISERAYRAKNRNEDKWYSSCCEEGFRYRDYFSDESKNERTKVNYVFYNNSNFVFEKVKDSKCDTCILTCPHAKYNKDNLKKIKKKDKSEFERLVNERNLRKQATQYLRASNLPLIPDLIDFKMAHLQLKREIKKQFENEINK